MARYGDFEIEVTGPHPCWIEIRYNDQTIHGIRHSELRDLEYGISRAIHDAKQRLGKNYQDEV